MHLNSKGKIKLNEKTTDRQGENISQTMWPARDEFQKLIGESQHQTAWKQATQSRNGTRSK